MAQRKAVKERARVEQVERTRRRSEATAGPLGRLLPPPDTRGPRVRMGVLWFFVLLASVTSGRWWAAGLWAVIAFLAGAQAVRVWAAATADPDSRDDAGASVADAPLALAAGLGAALVVAAAAFSTGLAGLVLVALATVGGIGLLGGRARRNLVEPATMGMLVSGIAAASVVLAVRVDLWAGLFLVLAVSLFDAGAFLFGAESSGRWEGPVVGVIGVLAVTFTMSTISATSFEFSEAWIAGAAIGVGCVVGQAVVSAVLPTPDTPASALRRIDAYVGAGPAFVACAWVFGG